MIYICKDVENESDSCKCKNEKQRYNQCCQECSDVRICKQHCDYAYYYNCVAKDLINV